MVPKNVVAHSISMTSRKKRWYYRVSAWIWCDMHMEDVSSTPRRVFIGPVLFWQRMVVCHQKLSLATLEQEPKSQCLENRQKGKNCTCFWRQKSTFWLFSHTITKREHFFWKNETYRKCFVHSAHNSSLNKKVKHKGQSVGLCFYNCINYTANFPMLNRFNDSCLQWRSSIRVSKILIINLWSRARASSALCRLYVL